MCDVLSDCCFTRNSVQAGSSPSALSGVFRLNRLRLIHENVAAPRLNRWIMGLERDRSGAHQPTSLIFTDVPELSSWVP